MNRLATEPNRLRAGQRVRYEVWVEVDGGDMFRSGLHGDCAGYKLRHEAMEWSEAIGAYVQLWRSRYDATRRRWVETDECLASAGRPKE